MTDIQRASDIVTELAAARTESPSEVAVAPDGTQSVIQWRGTPTTSQWLTAWVHKLMAAKLAEPYDDGPPGDTQAAREVRATNAARLDAWHRVLAGLPREGLEAARAHFERNGFKDGRWGYLKPWEVSQWVRARVARKIPIGKECGTHPDQWAHDCRKCSTPLGPDEARQRIAAIRAELAKRKDTQ